MDSIVFWELAIIFSLVLANGFFAAAELAIIAAQKGRLQQQAEQGDRGSQVALQLAANPNRFLPTVQVGISLVGTFAAAFSGAHLVGYFTKSIGRLPYPALAQRAEQIAFVIVVFGLAYVSVVLGELVPKRLALQNAAGFARIVALPMSYLATMARPMVWVMAFSTDCVLSLFGAKHGKAPAISVDDIQHLLEAGVAQGAVDPVERRLAAGALRLGDRTARDLMRPRTEIDAMDVNTPVREVHGALVMSGFSRLPVYEGDLDHIVGFVNLRDIARQQYMGWPIELRKMVQPALFVPETISVDRLLHLFQEQRTHLAIVLDEFGGTEGIVTLEDVLEELVGEILHDSRERKQVITKRGDDEWLVDGAVRIDELIDALALHDPVYTEPRDYTTVAGLVLDRLGRIPKVGEQVDWNQLLLRVIAMDGLRVDQIAVKRNSRDASA